MDICVRNASYYVPVHSANTYTLNHVHPSVRQHALSPKVRSEIYFNLIMGMRTKLWSLNTLLLHICLM
jgi:hypothetical protein